MEIGATNQSEKTLKIVFLRIGIYILQNNIVANVEEV